MHPQCPGRCMTPLLGLCLLQHHIYPHTDLTPAVDTTAKCKLQVYGSGTNLLLYALPIIDEAAIPDPGQVLHDELGGLCLSRPRLSTHLCSTPAHCLPLE